MSTSETATADPGTSESNGGASASAPVHNVTRSRVSAPRPKGASKAAKATPAKAAKAKAATPAKAAKAAPAATATPRVKKEKPPKTTRPEGKPFYREGSALAEAVEILKAEGGELHVTEITARIQKRGKAALNGKTPVATVGARLYQDIDKFTDTPFVQTGKSIFALKK